MKKIITVIGSYNHDMVLQTTRFPNPGETITAKKLEMFSGGKGANQAVAAARLGGDVYFITKVGNDAFGNNASQNFSVDNIRTDYILQDMEVSSGTAVILVNQEGQNCIVVNPGANNMLLPSDIEDCQKAIKEASYILMQLEIPYETVKYAIETAYHMNKKIVLNPAPTVPLDDNLYSKLFLITPNQTEAEMLTGIACVDQISVAKAADVLLQKGVKNVIITLGEKGAYFKNKEEEFLIPIREVDVKDTTGAGDIFNGALLVALAEEKNWKQAVAFANSASSIGVSRMGAQSSAPYRDEILV
ncbi:ribokinase [Aquimarina aquimarini]|uniref:ribokinase n=1 Tax=Aquimarina aquimarini TaxID=1191734 RepID=UPI000D55A13F|nr:ribokinase [Aquimarina aquimarini]